MSKEQKQYDGKAYNELKKWAKDYAEAEKDPDLRLGKARSFSHQLVMAHWQCSSGDALPVFGLCGSLTSSLPLLDAGAKDMAIRAGELIASSKSAYSAYLVGSFYTAMLPAAYRSKMGAFHTPPALVAQLMLRSGETGVSWASHTVIDPSCGAGAFLVPIALQMLDDSSGLAPADKLVNISARLKGVEIDPFCAWMAHVLVEAALIDICHESGDRLPVDTIITADALLYHHTQKYDLVIGNPPYGKLKLTPSMRETYKRSLFGHANLYGIFTDLALSLTSDKGVIAYLTPTSFLGGQYFKNLRELILTQSQPHSMDFVSSREGVFDDALQETILITLKNSDRAPLTALSMLTIHGLDEIQTLPIGCTYIPSGDAPWLVARNEEDAALIEKASLMPSRLTNLGYKVSTGQLVWNRHKDQLRDEREEGSLPLVWAESIHSTGFVFSGVKRNRQPWIKVEGNQQHLITRNACVLVQRTTSKEQSRRIVSTVIPQGFLSEHGGAVIENHVNMVHQETDYKISPEAISALLNSTVFDRLYRCISGSVAVSVYEMMAVPVPDVHEMQELDEMVRGGASESEVERWVDIAYGLENEEEV